MARVMELMASLEEKGVSMWGGDDFAATAANLKSLSQQLKERPYSLVRIKSLPDRRPGDGVEEGRR